MIIEAFKPVLKIGFFPLVLIPSLKEEYSRCYNDQLFSCLFELNLQETFLGLVCHQQYILLENIDEVNLSIPNSFIWMLITLYLSLQACSTFFFFFFFLNKVISVFSQAICWHNVKINISKLYSFNKFGKTD